MDKEQAIQEILSDLEHQPLQERRTFRAYLNQPELISLSSTNAELQSSPINPQTDNSYYNFTVNLPRPALDVKSVQLLKTIIPQAQCSIPDYSLVFPYYRLRTVPISATKGEVAYIDEPSYTNLNFVRLLPSSYKKETLRDVSGFTVNSWGMNNTFNDYEELKTELNKACINDITFNQNSHYIANDITFDFSETENKFIFQPLNVATAPTLNPYAEWDVSTTYAGGSTVFYNLNFYKAVTSNTGKTPTQENDFPWRRLYNTNWYTSWSVTQQYPKNTVVQSFAIFYISLVDVLGGGDPSTEPARWLNVSQYFVASPFFNSYLIAGYALNDVQTLLQFIERISGTTLGGDTEGTSIPGNQYVQYQTLARRLGFTWNGSFIPSNINSYFDDGVPFGSTIALFYNRLRPLPRYDIALTQELEESLGGNYYNINRNNYTADGYCNLVYSSIISIYTIIVGTSSVDTQRNANLLAMVEMNCGNLGIAMASGFIDTKLTKVQPDIYSIYIELRDENGQPYYLTNNATTTLLLKLTYD